MADIPTNPNPPEVQMPPVYRSLEEIRLRKAQLRMQLRQDTSSMHGLTTTLFKKEETSNSPSQRFIGMMTKGATFVDGLILAYKLFNRFHGGTTAVRKSSGLFGLFGKKKKKKKR